MSVQVAPLQPLLKEGTGKVVAILSADETYPEEVMDRYYGRHWRENKVPCKLDRDRFVIQYDETGVHLVIPDTFRNLACISVIG